MPWTTPKTWVAGEDLLAADFNTHIRDNLTHLYSGGLYRIAVLADHKSSGTAGQSITSGDWRTRDLNTEVSDINGVVTLSSNKFKPIAGTYFIIASAPLYNGRTANNTGAHQIRLRNVTASSTTLTGSSEQATNDGANLIATRSWVTGVFTANGTDEYEIQHRVVGNSTGGAAAGHTTEVYTQVILLALS